MSGTNCHFFKQAREKLWMALGEAAPVLVPVSHVMMCMNCTSDFSLTLRRHHCNACGKVRQSAFSFHSWCLIYEDTCAVLSVWCKTHWCILPLWAGSVPSLFQKQIPTEVPQRQSGQSVWPLLCWAQEKRWILAEEAHWCCVASLFTCKWHHWWHLNKVVTMCTSVGGSVSGACGNASPRTHRASRPLSAVFQSLQPPTLWKSRKSSSPLSQVCDFLLEL